jgi:hypothetical protein
MSQKFGMSGLGENGPCIGSLTEPQSYSEHQAALDATVFRVECDADELVLELDSGELWLRAGL